MNWGEEVSDMLVYVATRDRRWDAEAYTMNGEAILPLSGLSAGQEVVVLVPYLHQSAIVHVDGGDLDSTIVLEFPTYPAYLP